MKKLREIFRRQYRAPSGLRQVTEMSAEGGPRAMAAFTEPYGVDEIVTMGGKKAVIIESLTPEEVLAESPQFYAQIVGRVPANVIVYWYQIRFQPDAEITQ